MLRDSIDRLAARDAASAVAHADAQHRLTLCTILAEESADERELEEMRDAARGNRPWYYVYASYHTPADEWARLLTPGGDLSVRGTARAGRTAPAGSRDAAPAQSRAGSKSGAMGETRRADC